MESNNFEKQVQDKLADLTIQPSEKSWTGIESRIGTKEKSKRVLWFLLAGLFLLAGGGYLFLMEGKGNDNEIAQVAKQSTEEIIKKSAIDQGDSFNAISESDRIVSNESNGISKKSPDKSTDTNSSSLKQNLYSQNITGKMNSEETYSERKTKVNVSVGKKIATIKSVEPKPEMSALTSDNTTSKLKTSQNYDPDVVRPIVEESAVIAQKEKDTSSGNEIVVVGSIMQKKEISPEIKEEIATKEDNDLNEILKIGDNKKTSSSSIKSWKIGVAFSAERAYLGDGIQLGSDPDMSNIASDPNNYYSNSAGRPGSIIGQTPAGTASAPKNSYGFNAGVILKKQVSPKISFVTGLGYTYYTNSIMVGDQLPGGNYSSAGMLSPYRNNFHFVGLPLSTQFHLNTTRKIPLDLSVGVNVSQLIASDAVQYKSGVYEVDNSMFTKTQLGFNAGFSATFFRNLSIGPFYQYGLNTLAKEGLYGKKHLNFLGLKAEFIFRKNK